MPLLLVTLNNSPRRRSTQSEGNGRTVIPQTPLFSTVLTSHLGSAPSQVALSGDTSAPAVHDPLATELEALSTSDIAGPSQLIPSRFSTSATELVDDTFTAGHDALQLASTSSSAAGPVHPTFDSSASTSTGESAMVDSATGREESELVSILSDPSQPTFDSDAGTSLGEFTTVDDILTAGDEGLRFLSTRLGPADPSQPVFDFSTSANEITMVDNTRVPGYEASQSSATFSGPSQSTFDLNASASDDELPTVEETLAAGYELLQFLSTFPGPADPSQQSLDFGAGTSNNGSATVDDPWVNAYEVSQALYSLQGHSQPTSDLNAGASVGEFPSVEEMVQFLSNFLGSADPSQPAFDSNASTSAIESTTVDNARITGYEAPQSLSAPTFDLNVGAASVGEFSTVDQITGYEAPQSLSAPTFDSNAGAASVGDFSKVDETLTAGHELMEFLSTMSGPGDPSQPIFDLDAANDELADNQLAAELEALLFPSTPSGGTNRSMPTKNGSRRRRRANASSRQMATNNLIPDTLTTAPFPPGSDSQPSMGAFNPSGDRAVNVSDASATSSYPFSFGFSGSTSAGNVNASQPYTSVPGTIGGTSNSFNDAGTSNVFGGATIDANEQEQAIFSSQMSRPLFDYGMTGGQSIGMDTRTHEEDSSMDISFSAVDTMQPSSSSPVQRPWLSTPGSTNIFRTSNDLLSPNVANVGSSFAPASTVLGGIASVVCLRVLDLTAPSE